MTDRPSKYFVIGSVVVFVGILLYGLLARPRRVPDTEAGRDGGPSGERRPERLAGSVRVGRPVGLGIGCSVGRSFLPGSLWRQPVWPVSSSRPCAMPDSF